MRFLCPQGQFQHGCRALTQHGNHALQAADNALADNAAELCKSRCAALHFLHHTVELFFHGVESRTQLVILRRICARRVRGSILLHLRRLGPVFFQLSFGLLDAVLQCFPLLRRFAHVQILVCGLFVEQFVKLFLGLCNLRLEPLIILSREPSLAQLFQLFFQCGNRFTHWPDLAIKGF